MRAYRARHSRSKVKPTVRLAWSLVVVIAVVGLCGFTLYWTQSRLDTVSARLDGLERNVKTVVSQYSAAQTGQPATSSATAPSAAAQTSAANPVRLAHLVKCETTGNLVAVTYDPAQLFTGADAVKLAASNGDAVTGDTYIFDPSKDVFTGNAPVNAVVTVHKTPSGWDGPTPKTIAELAADLQTPEGGAWLSEYFWLRFNGEYVVSLEQYEVPATS